MWLITHATTGSCFYFAPGKKTYTVGRQGADLEIQGDICVSRSHAVVHILDDHIELEDVGSKFGSFHNKGIEKNAALEKGCKVKLQVNDLIRFGRLQSVWKVQCLTFNTVTSSLAKEESANVIANLVVLGGKMLTQWSSDCTHLTMKEPSVTMKLLHALVDEKYVVTPNYWKDLAAAVAANKSSLPKPERYRPNFGEENIDVGIKSERKQLFKGATFVFLSRKHYDMYEPIVKAAGGTCKDIISGIQKAFLIKSKVIVIQYTPSTQTQSSQTISTIADFLQNHSKRVIPEYEIGLAILNCSMEEYCNPSYKMPESMAQTIQTQRSDNSMAVDLTDDDTTPSVNTQSMDFEIPETNEPPSVASTPYDNEDQETMPNMHITETPMDAASRKRKHSKTINSDSGGQSDDDELFTFGKKPYVNKDNEAAKAKSKGVESEQKVGAENKNKTVGRSIKKSAFAEFYNKNQIENNSKTESGDGRASTSKVSRKRPHIQILGEDNNEVGDEDDLFCFGETQNKKRSRQEEVEVEPEDDLFGFKDNNRNHSHTIPVDEDSNDVLDTQQFVAAKKPTKTCVYTVPKPKILPRKISAVDWLSRSMGKANIKCEVKNEDVMKTDTDDDVKLKIEDLNMSEDHRKWVDSLKDAIQIQQVSLNVTLKSNEKSHYVYRSKQIATDNMDGNARNFKAFVKRYQTPSNKDSTGAQIHLR